MTEKDFNPLIFLAALGAGGIAIMPFVVMQYTVEHGDGLITRAKLWDIGFEGLIASQYLFLEAIMVVFTSIHFILTILFGIQLGKWLLTGKHKEIMNDPLKNSALLAPAISLLMTMNIFIGPLRYFLPVLSDNFQALFLPAMMFWSIIFIITMLMEIGLLGISFKRGFDIDKISFGWLLHPFLLGMLTTVGTGIAAMSKDVAIADTAAFMSLISGSMGAFLLLVKLIMVFRSHFKASGLPDKQFLPSFLIVIPNVTLYAISAFRFGHYLENHVGLELGPYFYFVIGISFAFEIWYLLFGFWLLIDYFKQNHFKEFYVTQWSFICPLVAFGVLGAFTYATVIQSPLIYWLIFISIIISVLAYFELLYKNLTCLHSDQNTVCVVKNGRKD